MKIEIPFDPQLNGDVLEAKGEWGIILAHGEQSKIDDGILNALAKKLMKKDISTLRFNFPFRVNASKKIDNIGILDQAFVTTWNYAIKNYPNIRWAVGGHGIGGLTAVRAAGIMYDDSGIPPVVCLNYPMYPYNRPELVDTMALGALLGDGIFCQGDLSKRGTYDRLRNQIQMMARHAKIVKIKGANHLFEVKGKEISTVAYWIANDIARYLRELGYEK